MAIPSQGLMTAALLDSLGRFIGNVGVPAAIALLVLWQTTPRLDAMNTSLAQIQTTLQVETVACARPVVSPAGP